MNKTLFAFALSALVLTGCASKGQPSTGDATDGGATAGSGSADGSSSSAAGGSGIGSGQALSSGTNSGSGAGNSSQKPLYDLNAKVVYFDYDIDEMQAEGMAVADNWGRYLAANPALKLRLEGHTDERGSREYNLALAERRTQSVSRALKAAGATDGQLSSVSYGEERPAVPGSSEEAWSQNRRVELVR